MAAGGGVLVEVGAGSLRPAGGAVSVAVGSTSDASIPNLGTNSHADSANNNIMPINANRFIGLPSSLNMG